MKLHIIMHESFESPAAFEAWAFNKGHEVTYTRLYEWDSLPETPDCDFLLIMGAPQTPATTTEESPYFDAQREIACIKSAIGREKIVVGVCTGAQLIGEALGAPFEHSPNREIGVFPMTLTEDGKLDPLIGAFPEKFLVGHWHGDMPGLAKDAKILATSEGCPRQIVRYAPKIYGFQCHFEFTPEAIEALIENSTDELDEYKSLPFVETPKQLREHNYTEMNELLFGFLDRLTGQK